MCFECLRALSPVPQQSITYEWIPKKAFINLNVLIFAYLVPRIIICIWNFPANICRILVFKSSCLNVTRTDYFWCFNVYSKNEIKTNLGYMFTKILIPRCILYFNGLIIFFFEQPISLSTRHSAFMS